MRAENFIGSFQAKVRPCGPTNRAAAAAGRRDRRPRRWGERPPVLPAHSRRKAGLAAAHGRYLAVSADHNGHALVVNRGVG